MRRKYLKVGMVSCLVVFFLILVGNAFSAAPPKSGLPEIISISAYDVGSSTYIQAGAVADALMKKYGMKTRVIPSGTDVSRTLTLRERVAHFCLSGVGTYYFAAEGLEDFATLDWGPQAIQAVWNVFPVGGSSMVTTKDSGIKTPYDLKGKRVFWIPGAPAHNITNTAFLAFAKLTWKDVKRVDYPSYAAVARGLIEGGHDAGFNTATHSSLYELETSPRGLFWPEFPASDVEGWKRLQAIAPYMIPYHNYGGAGQSPQGVDTMTYPFPLVAVYDWQDEELVYQFTKAIDQTFPMYKDAYPAMANWDKAKSMVVGLTVPFHKGTVRYLKEIGVWNAKFEAWQQNRIERQKKLKDAWREAVVEAKQKGLSEKAFTEFWTKKNTALK